MINKTFRQVIRICIILNIFIILIGLFVVIDTKNLKFDNVHTRQIHEEESDRNFPVADITEENKQSKFIESDKREKKFSTLVDLPINFNFSHKHVEPRYKILWYNLPSWKNIQNQNNALETCEINNCFVTVNTSYIDSANAIIFVPTVDGMGRFPPVSGQDRNPEQIWIFYSLEPPMNFRLQTYKSSSWLNTMNWSMTYRFDSDILSPYGTFKIRRNPPKRDYRQLFLQKTKMAAWIVSHCDAESGRDEYVKELAKYGVTVDIFGACSNTGFMKDTNMDKVLNQYKFFIAFENSFCKEYISCKVFRKYNLDAILIVRGGANYTNLMPAGTYINTADFASISKLAEFLLKLDSDQVQYIRMLKRKDKFEALDEDHFGETFAMCELCKKLNNVRKYRHTYRSMNDFLQDRQCWLPKDIPNKINKPHPWKRSRIYIE